MKVWKGYCLGKDFLFKSFLMGCGLKQIIFYIYVAYWKYDSDGWYKSLKHTMKIYAFRVYGLASKNITKKASL